MGTGVSNFKSSHAFFCKKFPFTVQEFCFVCSSRPFIFDARRFLFSRLARQATATASDTYSSNNLNQYTDVSGAHPSYDANGNMTGDGGAWTYSYDAENRLTAASNGSSVSAVYAYDPLNHRVHKSGAGVTEAFFLSDGVDDEIAEYDGAGALVKRYVPGPAIDQPIAAITAAGGRTYFHTDRLGSVIAMSGGSGTKTEGPYSYDPYGFVCSGVGNSTCSLASGGIPYKFTGRRLDPETGLYYYRARYYSHDLGRFLQTDPVGYEADLNLYTYVGNDPTDNTDETGLACDGVGPCSPQTPEGAAANLKANREIGEAIVNHPGETMQVVGTAISLIPSPIEEFGPPIAGAGRIVKSLDGEDAAASRTAPSTLSPGPHAGESVPATGPRVTADQQRQVDRIGNESGCHTCGTRNPGTQSGHWVGDHQPSTRLNPPGGQQRLYPHCLSCSRRQGGEVRRAVQQQQNAQRPPDEGAGW